MAGILSELDIFPSADTDGYRRKTPKLGQRKVLGVICEISDRNRMETVAEMAGLRYFRRYTVEVRRWFRCNPCGIR